MGLSNRKRVPATEISDERFRNRKATTSRRVTYPITTFKFSVLGSVKDGIQIDMRSLDQVVISEDGKTATIGGGARIKEAVAQLWAAGKETCT